MPKRNLETFTALSAGTPTARHAFENGKPSEYQDTNDDGVPLFSIDILEEDEQFGKQTTKTTSVVFPSSSTPNFKRYQQLVIENPQLSYYVSNGQLRESLTCDSVKVAKETSK